MKRLLDIALIAIFVLSVAPLFLAHEDPFARDALCAYTGFCPVMPNAKAWNKIFYDLAVGALVTLVFYLLVVRLPDYQRRQRLKAPGTRSNFLLRKTRNAPHHRTSRLPCRYTVSRRW